MEIICSDKVCLLNLFALEFELVLWLELWIQSDANSIVYQELYTVKLASDCIENGNVNIFVYSLYTVGC